MRGCADCSQCGNGDHKLGHEHLSGRKSISGGSEWVAVDRSRYRPHQFASARLPASLFMTSAQPATSRYKAMHVVYVSESTDTSRGREADVVSRPRKTPAPRQTIPTTIAIRHSRNNRVGSSPISTYWSRNRS